MKKQFLLTGLCLCALSLFTASCDDDDNVARMYNVTVTVTSPVDYSDLKDLKVVAMSENGDETVGTMDSLTATIRLVAGTYTFKATANNDYFNFNGSVKSAINGTGSVSVTLQQQKQAGGIIFKEIYSTGVSSYYFADGFFELFNNSDTVQYLDGLIVGLVVNGYGNVSPWADTITGALPDFYPCTNHTVYFPGSGKEHPILPGESVVCASKPINHSARELSDGDVQSPVDLSNADWDIFIPSSTSDVDYPTIPNMLVAASTFGFDFMPSVPGQSFILAKLPVAGENAVANFAADEQNYKKYEGAYMSSLCIPAEYVIDAVDIIYFNENHNINKTILDTDDSGYTYYSGSSDEWTSPMYTGKGLRRKCTKVTSTRVYYKDTNNSSEDFILGGQTPTPGVNPTVAD